MDYIRFFLKYASLFTFFVLLSQESSNAQYSPKNACGKFCEDDPLLRVPAPLPVGKLSKFELDPSYDEIIHIFTQTGKRAKDGSTLHAQNINTLDEVPDSDWYTNRPPLSIEQLRAGPTQEHAPALDQPLTILSAKSEGATPGLVIQDAKGQRFVMKFDAPGHALLETGADVVGSRLYYALGYNVPENYPTIVRREQFRLTPKSSFTDPLGHKRPLTKEKLEEILDLAATLPDGSYSAMASYFLSGQIIGPWMYHGTRSDDPNDIYPHQNMRELRGLKIFGAWINNADATSLNTLNTVQTIDAIPRVRHYLIDFGSIMGSGATGPRYPFLGYAEEFNFKDIALQISSLGLAAPRWEKARYLDLPEVGNFESEKFDPTTWVPSYRNPAFDLCQPEDAFWAIRKMMAIPPEGVRAIVESAGYRDPASIDWITKTLLERRQKIVAAFAEKEIFLDGFQLKDGQLLFTDLALKYVKRPSARVEIQWFLLNNKSRQRRRLSNGKQDATLPKEAKQLNKETILEAELASKDIHRITRISIANREGSLKIIGIERLPYPDRDEERQLTQLR